MWRGGAGESTAGGVLQHHACHYMVTIHNLFILPRGKKWNGLTLSITHRISSTRQLWPGPLLSYLILPPTPRCVRRWTSNEAHMSPGLSRSQVTAKLHV